MTKHLVLGSEGQIGSYVCDEIEKNGDEVLRFDIVLDKHHDLASYESALDMFVHQAAHDGQAPCGKGAEMETEEFKKDLFVHFLAFDVGGSKYLAQHQNSKRYLDRNISLMQNTFRWLDRNKVPFYFASSQMQNMTDSAYGTLKNLGEFYTRALGGINVRFWNVYGYESDPEKTHVITDFIKMALTEKKILCRTDGTEERNFTYAKDAAKILYRIAENYDAIKNYDWSQHYYADDPRFDYIPVVSPSDYSQWYSMREVAEVIANEIGDVEIFYSNKKDTTQTVQNSILRLPLEFKNIYSFPSEAAYELKAGIKEMVELIAKDLE